MADLNLFHGGYGRAISSGNNAGQFPSIYPSPTRMASHHRPMLFTVDNRFGPFVELPGMGDNPAVDFNQAYAVRATAPNLTAQTASLVGKTVGLIRVPTLHLLTSQFVHAHGGTYGAGMVFDVTINRMNAQTGALVAAVVAPAALLGLVMPAAGAALNVWAALTPADGGLFVADGECLEVGIKIVSVPAPSGSWSGLVADLDMHINLVSKVESFDIR